MKEICFWGVCPSDERLVGWVSRSFLPGAGHPEKAELPVEYRGIFHPCVDESGFCPECGARLAFKATLQSLGCCENCVREYGEADLTRKFCPDCGHPVSIEDELKKQYAKGRVLAALFDDLSTLQKHGFLPTLR